MSWNYGILIKEISPKEWQQGWNFGDVAKTRQDTVQNIVGEEMGTILDIVDTIEANSCAGTVTYSMSHVSG